MISIEDLLTLGHEMLEPTPISPRLTQEAVTLQFPELADVVPGCGCRASCPWGLGIEIRGSRSPHWTRPGFPAGTVGHFGVSGSLLWADHTHGVICAFLETEKSGAWHKEHWSTVNEELLALIPR